jgi:hypothetical protein
VFCREWSKLRVERLLGRVERRRPARGEQKKAKSKAPRVKTDVWAPKFVLGFVVWATRPLTRLRVRNASPSLLLAQEFLPIFRWAGSVQLPEHSREVLLRFEAASHGDIQHTQVGRAQHLFRTLHSLAQDKPVRAFAG